MKLEHFKYSNIQIQILNHSSMQMFQHLNIEKFRDIHARTRIQATQHSKIKHFSSSNTRGRSHM